MGIFGFLKRIGFLESEKVEKELRQDQQNEADLLQEIPKELALQEQEAKLIEAAIKELEQISNQKWNPVAFTITKEKAAAIKKAIVMMGSLEKYKHISQRTKKLSQLYNLLQKDAELFNVHAFFGERIEWIFKRLFQIYNQQEDELAKIAKIERKMPVP